MEGALVGAVGGARAPVGGGTFVGNVAAGAAEGAFTGGLDAALWNQDPGQGMLWGAISGAAFATATYTGERALNKIHFDKWGSNEEVLNFYRSKGDVNMAGQVLQKRFGIDFRNYNVLDDNHWLIKLGEQSLREEFGRPEIFQDLVNAGESPTVTGNAFTMFEKSSGKLIGTAVKHSAFTNTDLSLQATITHELRHQLEGPIAERSVAHANIYRYVLDRSGALRLNPITIATYKKYLLDYGHQGYGSWWKTLYRRF